MLLASVAALVQAAMVVDGAFGLHVVLRGVRGTFAVVSGRSCGAAAGGEGGQVALRGGVVGAPVAAWDELQRTRKQRSGGRGSERALG